MPLGSAQEHSFSADYTSAEATEKISFTEEERRKVSALPRYEREFLQAEAALGKGFDTWGERREDLYWNRQEAFDILLEKVRNLPSVLRFSELIRSPEADVVDSSGEYLQGFVEKPLPQEDIGRSIKDCLYEFSIALPSLGTESNAIVSLLFKRIAEDIRRKRRETSLFQGKYFDGKEEIAMIRSGDASAPQAREHRRDRMETIKQYVGEQLGNIGKLNKEIETVVVTEGVTDRGKLEGMLSQRSIEYQLAPRQVDTYRILFVLIENRHAAVEEVLRWFEPKEEDLFKSLFGERPVGVVSVIPGSVSIGFICEDLRDYFRTTGIGLDAPKTQTDSKSNTEGTAILHIKDLSLRNKLGDAVFSINASVQIRERYQWNDAQCAAALKSTCIHEEKHVFNSLFDYAQRMGESRDLSSRRQDVLVEDSSKKNLRRFEADTRQLRLISEQRSKDEILAYLKDNSSIAGIRSRLYVRQENGGRYDYLSKYFSSREHMHGRRYVDKSVAESIEKRCRERYETVVAKALDVVGVFELMGLGRGDIVGLFQAEPLSVWPKVRDRIFSQPAVQQKLENLISNAKQEIIAIRLTFN